MKFSGRFREPDFLAGPEMLPTAQGAPHPSANLGQTVDTVCLDSRGKFMTGFRTPYYQRGHEERSRLV
jgi:hypothetical protein